jgi:hypothetical protein
MLETVTLQRSPPVAARRTPSRALSHGQDPKAKFGDAK